jgi:hypothetical protein
VAGVATVERVEWDKDRFVMSGKCRYSLILLHDGEMTTKDVELPLRFVSEHAPRAAKLGYEAQVQVLMAKGRLDDRNLTIDAELGIGMRLWDEEALSVVTATTVGERLEAVRDEMVLCYPSREDTVWSVGKRYHAPLETLITSNRLTDEKRADDPSSLSGIRVIAI